MNFEVFLFIYFFPRGHEKRLRQLTSALLRILGAPRKASINPLVIHHHFGHKSGYTAFKKKKHTKKQTPDRTEKTKIIILAMPLTMWRGAGYFASLCLYHNFATFSLTGPCLPLSAHLMPLHFHYSPASRLMSLFLHPGLCSCCLLSLECFFKSTIQVLVQMTLS